jgi:hypothetical protein
MNRRSFIKGATGILVPAVLLGDIEPVRRFWQLDRTMAFDTRYPESVIRPDYDFYVVGDVLRIENERLIVTHVEKTIGGGYKATFIVGEDYVEQSLREADLEPLSIRGLILRSE